ncbi:MAG: lipase maturation factor family protein [Myxococcota bacterium]
MRWPRPELRARARQWRARLREPAPYWLTRFVFLRSLGFLYFVAFASLALQLLPLIGSDGLLPAQLYLDQRTPLEGGRLAGFLAHPSLFWLDASDGFLLVICWAGAALSLVVCLGYANALLMLALWVAYLSFVQIGQVWFRFGWEFQLLETGFLAIFLCPLLDGRPFPNTAPPRAVIWLLRWLTFRILLGAGLIKLRGDPCWRELTCLIFHYETQPVPHPLSWVLHNLPEWTQRLGVAFNHLAELIAPFFVFGPRRVRHLAGGLLVLFQALLIASGNLSFLNWLTIVPILACFDDTLWRRVLPRRSAAAADRARAGARRSPLQTALVAGLAVAVGLLSIAPVRNLLSSGQIMNTSFDRLHLVNSYGAFGSVGRERHELILEGTSDAVLGDETVWREYAWKCKPGDPHRRPCFITPYHYRLDWLIWFAAMSSYEHHPWLIHLIWKLLHDDAGALSLLAENPFPDAPPRFVRAELYRYEFTGWGEPGGAWWRRHRLRSYLAPLSADNEKLRAFLAGYGWID